MAFFPRRLFDLLKEVELCRGPRRLDPLGFLHNLKGGALQNFLQHCPLKF